MTADITDPPAPIADAWSVADAAIRRSRVAVRTLDAVADLERVSRLFERIWRTDTAGPPVPADVMVALCKAGSYVSGAFEGEELVGACLGFFAAPARRSLHSHIAGVIPQVRGRDVGFALKLHQRAWAMTCGVREITWTYDPLIGRNAHFNLTKLGAEATEYLPDFYGPIDDGINRRDDSDRLLVRWRLDGDATVAACRGEHRLLDLADVRRSGARVALDRSADGGPRVCATEAATVLVAVPPDVERMRATDPDGATRWRQAVRDVLGGLLADGARVRGFDRGGWYVVDRVDTGERTERS